MQIVIQISDINFEMFDHEGTLVVVLSGVSLEQIESNPDLKKAVDTMLDRLIAQSKKFGMGTKPDSDPAAMTFDEIDRALRAFTSRTPAEILAAIKACPVSYPRLTKHQRQQILVHLSIHASIFEPSQIVAEAAKASYNAVLDWENEHGADHD